MKPASIAVLACAVAASGIALRAAENNQQPTRRVVKTLPMVRIGETPPNVEPMPGRQTLKTSKPPAPDPYAWITPANASGAPGQWTLSSGTNITASLVKFNHFTVVVRDGMDREIKLPRKSLNKKEESILAGFEQEKAAESR